MSKNLGDDGFVKSSIIAIKPLPRNSDFGKTKLMPRQSQVAIEIVRVYKDGEDSTLGSVPESIRSGSRSNRSNS